MLRSFIFLAIQGFKISSHNQNIDLSFKIRCANYEQIHFQGEIDS